MSDRFVVDARQITALTKRFALAPVILAEEMRTGATRAILAVEGKAKELAPVDTGTLRRSITHDVQPMAGGIRASAGSAVPYAEVVEKGRGAGKPMPPTGSLLGWMRRHGIDEGAEFVIRRAIGRRGIPARPYLSRALRELRPQISAEIRQIPARVVGRLRGAA